MLRPKTSKAFEMTHNPVSPSAAPVSDSARLPVRVRHELRFRRLTAVSYTHLTLPTTPYV